MKFCRGILNSWGYALRQIIFAAHCKAADVKNYDDQQQNVYNNTLA